MKNRFSIPRAAVSLLLVSLVVGTALVPPFLDRDEPVRVTLESAHDPSHCPRTHDHQVCAQIDVTQGIVTPPTTPRAPAAVEFGSLRLRKTPTQPKAASLQPPSRGPPT